MSALIFLRIFSLFPSSAARSTFLSMFAVVVGLLTLFVVGLLVVVVAGLAVVVEHVVDDGLAVVWLRHNFLSTFELCKSPLVCWSLLGETKL